MGNEDEEEDLDKETVGRKVNKIIWLPDLNCICISNYRYIPQRNQSVQRECNTKWTSYFHIALHTYQAAEKLPAAKLQEYRDIFLYFDRSVKAIFQNSDFINFILRGGAGCIGAEDLTQVSELKNLDDYDMQRHIHWSLSKKSHFPKVMRSFGWNPKDEEVKDMVNVIDQVR